MFYIEHYMLRTNNPEKSIEFYKEVMRMEFVCHDPRHSENPPCDIYFLKDPETDFMIELKHYHGKEFNNTGDVFGHVGYRVDDIKPIVEKAEALGYSYWTKNSTSSFGKKYLIATIVTPEGVDLHLVQKLSDF